MEWTECCIRKKRHGQHKQINNWVFKAPFLVLNSECSVCKLILNAYLWVMWIYLCLDHWQKKRIFFFFFCLKSKFEAKSKVNLCRLSLENWIPKIKSSTISISILQPSGAPIYIRVLYTYYTYYQRKKRRKSKCLSFAP